MLTPKQKSYLRSLAHKLDPVAFIGKSGISTAAVHEIERGLRDHELIKIKVSAESQEDFIALCDKITESLEGAEIVQKIGHIFVLYRKSTKKKKEHIQLPKESQKRS